jgi:hypothetical protein
MAGVAAADLGIGRVPDRAAGVAGGHADHAGLLAEDFLDAPEAAAGKGGGFVRSRRIHGFSRLALHDTSRKAGEGDG